MDCPYSHDGQASAGAFRPELWVRSYRGGSDRHNHGFHQFLIGLDGHLNLYTAAGEFLLTRESGVVIRRRHTHEFHVTGSATILVVDVAVGAWDGLERALRRSDGIRSIPVSAGLAELLREARPLAGPMPRRIEVSWQPSERYLKAFRSAVGAVFRPCGDDRVGAALSRFDAVQEEIPKLDEVAAKSGVSPSHLSRLFNRHLGTPPGRLARGRRLQHAARLLIWTDHPIAGIASACGYADQATFTRAFSRAFGVSPGALRKQHQRQDLQESAKTR